MFISCKSSDIAMRPWRLKSNIMIKWHAIYVDYHIHFKDEMGFSIFIWQPCNELSEARFRKTLSRASIKIATSIE